jgi:hypothetical protein
MDIHKSELRLLANYVQFSERVMNLSVAFLVMSVACALIAVIAIIAAQRRSERIERPTQPAVAPTPAKSNRGTNSLGFFGERVKK